ncbi:hypothetical protein V496_08409 [Pseudogymnoascus sp. VKM F-4515 (FW-2607)]|nr:hypothetical protein V496_08409 [Pseudogymnoascus sp. VKM F-4515 (FW-2607)]
MNIKPEPSDEQGPVVPGTITPAQDSSEQKTKEKNTNEDTKREQSDLERRKAKIRRANKLQESFQRSKEGTVESDIIKAEDKYFEVFDWFENLSLEEQGQDERQSELTNARAAYQEAAHNELQKSDIKDDEIGSAKVLAKLSVNRSKLALVEIGSVHNAHCYRIVGQGLVDQTQLEEAPDYRENLWPKTEITSKEAANVIGVAFKGGPESLGDDFDVEEALKAKFPVNSAFDREKQRKTRPTVYLIGHLSKYDGNPNKNKWNLWMMSRHTWQKRTGVRDVIQLADMSIGKAVRQFNRYQMSLLLGPDFEPEETPERDVSNTKATSASPERDVFNTKATSVTPEPEDGFVPKESYVEYDMEEL